MLLLRRLTFCGATTFSRRRPTLDARRLTLILFHRLSEILCRIDDRLLNGGKEGTDVSLSRGINFTSSVDVDLRRERTYEGTTFFLSLRASSRVNGTTFRRQHFFLTDNGTSQHSLIQEVDDGNSPHQAGSTLVSRRYGSPRQNQGRQPTFSRRIHRISTHNSSAHRGRQQRVTFCLSLFYEDYNADSGNLLRASHFPAFSRKNQEHPFHHYFRFSCCIIST